MTLIVPDVLFVRDADEAGRCAAVFDSPHSGTTYPADFDTILPDSILRRAEDTFVEDLYESAPAAGAALLAAHFPRSYIDANRPEDDIDLDLMDGPWTGAANPTVKSQYGQGLVWRICPPDHPIYDRKLSPQAVAHRLATYHRPYHQTLKRLLDERHRQFGAVWHVNCHSMPAVSSLNSPEGPGHPRAEFVLGDRDGTTASAAFVAVVEEALKGLGFEVKRNDPYKGVELVRAYSDPAARRHSLQIEINRKLYMDEDTFEKRPDYPAFKEAIGKLVTTICDYTRQEAAAAAV